MSDIVAANMTEPQPLTGVAKRPLAVLIAAFLMLAIAYSIVNPLYEATDELRHARFVRYLLVNGELPVQGQEACRSQSHHPPLFYMLAAAATFWVPGTGDVCAAPPSNPFWAYRYWEVGVDNKNQYLHGSDESFPWAGDVLSTHLIRFLNVLIGAGAIWLTWASGRLLWPGRPALALGGAALLAFNPMFLYMSAAINNDVIAAFSGVLILFACLKLLRDPNGLSRRWGVLLGLAFGIALLSKLNLAASGLLLAITITWVAWRRRQWRLWLEVAVLSIAATLLLSGWWFLRNQQLYGDPTGFRVLTELWGVRNPVDSLGLAVQELPYAWSTLWGRFGFGQIPLPDTYYRATQLLVAAGLVGALIRWFLVRRQGDEVDPSLSLLFLNVLLFFAVLFNYMLISPAGPMGRFFFPGLPALVLLTAAGLETLVRGWQTLIEPRLIQRRPSWKSQPGSLGNRLVTCQYDGGINMGLAGLPGASL